MRGSPQQQLRQALARLLRHVLAGSLVLTATGVCVAAWLAIAVEMAPVTASAVSIAPARLDAVSDRSGSPPAVRILDSADFNQTPLALNADSRERVQAALIGGSDASAISLRRTGSSEINARSAEPTNSDAGAAAAVPASDWRQLLVDRSAGRDNIQAFVEPMRELVRPRTRAEDAEVLVERVAARSVTEPFVEPLRGLSRPPTLEELRAGIVERAASRDDEVAFLEASYAIDAGVLQSPELGRGDVVEATISFYYCALGDTAEGGDGGTFCGVMRDGSVVYDGAAACAWVYLGQRFVIVGDPTERVYTCADTGSAVHGLHRDIWFYTAEEGWGWQLSVGTTGVLLIVD